MNILKNERTCLLVTAFIISVFLSTSTFLPLVDLPQFAGQVHLLKNYVLNNTDLSWYADIEINYLIPYWTINLIALPLAFILPINYAVNTTIGIIFFLYVYGFSQVRSKFNAPSILDWILIPTFFGAPYMWGFSTFLMGVTISSFFLLYYIDYLDKNNRKNFIKVIVLGVFLYFSHILCFLFMGLVLGLVGLMRSWDEGRILIAKCLSPLLFLVFLIPLFFVNNGFFDSDPISAQIIQSQTDIIVHSIFDKLYNLLLFSWGYYFNSQILESYAVLLSILLLGLPWGLGLRPSRKIWKYAPLLSFFIVWLALPHYAGKVYFIYSRYIIYFFPFYILLFEKPENCNSYSILKSLSVCICLLALIFPITDIYLFNKKENYFVSILSSLAPEKRVIHFEFDDTTSLANEGTLRFNRTYGHFPIWYQSMRNGWADWNFAWYPTQIFRYKSVDVTPEIKVRLNAPIEQLPSIKNCDVYDYLIVRLSFKVEQEKFNHLLSASTCSHKLIKSQDDWHIYGY